MGKSKAPPAPDPVKTAQAQGAANKEAAVATQLGSMVGQRNPWGTLTYNQVGRWDDGTPKTEAVTSLSPSQQALFDIGQATDLDLAKIGQQQVGRIGNLLSSPLDLSSSAIEDRLYQLASPRLNQRFTEARDREISRLANMGITDPNSEMYRNTMRGLGEQENDAFNQLYLTGRQQGLQELLTERNQPLNEISALLSGAQIGMPQFSATPGYNQNPTDVMGATYGSYNAASQNAQMANANRNAMMGGLFGLGGAAITAAPFFSDRRLKKNIRLIGKTAKGLNWYAFDYIWNRPGEGVMADEVEKVMPWAVHNRYGFKAVDYAEVL